MTKRRRGRRGRWFLAVLVAALVAAVVGPAGAETPAELRAKRKQVQAEKAAAAAEVDAISADAATLEAALADIQALVDAQQAAVDDARRAAAEAEAAVAAAEAAIADLEARRAALRAEMVDSAVEAYMSFQTPEGSLAAFGEDPWRQARDEALVGFATGTRIDQLDELRALDAELENRRRAADEAAADAQAHRAEVEARLADLQAARDQQAAVVDEVEARLDERLAEVAALESLDAELAAEIRAEEQRIAEAIAREQAARARGSVTIPDDAPVELTTVRGIVVNVAIAEQTEGLLAAMAAEGFTLGGGGYRSNAAQIALRKAHCGTSDYDIWEKPASRCRPPTARPGRSDHEKGLAIDFTYRGRAIRSRSSDVFRALQRIAPSYGFRNLPSEPWHWSAK
ncbi:MAG: hypothetical protein D6683_18255 [Actinomyces sp.]|nr:MAG: hypothetical protein D6683_18255 [Actinomyces sp.]